MKRQELISKILKDKFDIKDVIVPQTNLIEEFGFESIAFVELASVLSKEAGFDIPLYQAVKWTTVQSILSTLDANEEAAASK